MSHTEEETLLTEVWQFIADFAAREGVSRDEAIDVIVKAIRAELRRIRATKEKQA